MHVKVPGSGPGQKQPDPAHDPLPLLLPPLLLLPTPVALPMSLPVSALLPAAPPPLASSALLIESKPIRPHAAIASAITPHLRTRQS